MRHDETLSQGITIVPRWLIYTSGIPGQAGNRTETSRKGRFSFLSREKISDNVLSRAQAAHNVDYRNNGSLMSASGQLCLLSNIYSNVRERV